VFEEEAGVAVRHRRRIDGPIRCNKRVGQSQGRVGVVCVHTVAMAGLSQTHMSSGYKAIRQTSAAVPNVLRKRKEKN
jgi:hypothetical protein